SEGARGSPCRASCRPWALQVGSNDFSQRRGSNDCAVPLRQLSEHDLLCQAATALAKVTRCKNDYEPLIINLKSLHGKAGCSLSTDNEIYLRNFLPELGNFTQALYRRLATTAAN
uniref:Interleukin-4 n=1 Tax=Anas zonorhyncha TaxID=75864 RepID=A0A8B9VIP3_9AVES